METGSKSLGIITYIDDTPAMREEFTWLYKSWIYSGCWKRSDLVIAHHPALSGTFPDEPGLITLPVLPYSQTEPLFENYHFINSIACLSGAHINDLLRQYRWLLRTDADVFLTHYLADFEPIYPVHGRGNYHFRADFREKMLDFCKRHNVRHDHRFGCGHSVMLDSDKMIAFLDRQMHWARMLAEDFGPDKANWGTWPGWYRSVLSMYAAEIAANERWGDYLQNCRERVLDMESNNDGFIDGLTLHIHATAGSTCFSKYKYRQGEYDAIQPDELDRRRVGEYCLWIAKMDINALKVLAGYGYE
ncbi:hypothetical protein [Scandinavium sp.]|uniref:DUF7164 domain-containing protein n=1 Tax=Scandinavium sp. TaxID=2830653 RepID=UPI0028A1BDE2|nr:hypothetical protein [Scandinavium sp.]